MSEYSPDDCEEMRTLISQILILLVDHPAAQNRQYPFSVNVLINALGVLIKSVTTDFEGQKAEIKYINECLSEVCEHNYKKGLKDA